MLKALVLLREPLTFGECKIYPPTVREVVTNEHFGYYHKMLTLTKEDVYDMVKDKVSLEDSPTPLKFLLENARFYPEMNDLLKKGFYFFLHEEVVFLPDQEEIRLVSNLGKVLINEENFFDFQNLLRESLGDKSIPPPVPINPNEDPRIRRIKEKARERDRLKAKQSSKKGISLDTILVAICCMGIGITPLNIGEMSYGAVGALMSMLQEKEKYDIDIRSLLAGADSKKVKPKYWIRNSDKE